MGCGLGLPNYEVAEEGELEASAGHAEGSASCAPGSFRCAGAELHRCDGSGWELTQLCPSDAQCSASQERCLVCPPQVLRCTGRVLERCQSDQWLEELVCQEGQACDAIRGACSDCVPGDVRCASDKVLEACEQGVWREMDACATNEVCDAGRAECRICTYGETVCAREGDDEVQLTCNANRDGWDATLCPLGCLDTAPAHCKACQVVGARSCSSATRLRYCTDTFEWGYERCPNRCVELADANGFCE